MIDPDRTAEAIRGITESAWGPFLLRHVGRLGFRFGREAMVLTADASSGRLGLELATDARGAEVDAWIDLDEIALVAAHARGTPLGGACRIELPKGSRAAPPVAELILRALGRTQADDDLAFACSSWFGFASTQVVWHYPSRPMRLLMIPAVAALGGADLFVTDLFSHPSLGPCAIGGDPTLSGYGYEVALAVEPAERARFGKELHGWVRHFVELEGRAHPHQGEWLEYPGGAAIAGTDLAGFVITPAGGELPRRLPRGARSAHLNVLFGVTARELAYVKGRPDGVDALRARADAASLGDVTLARRPSVV
jgi:hypothetical protein